MPGRSIDAKRSLFRRLFTLLIVGVVVRFFQSGYERNGEIWMLLAESFTYLVLIVVFLAGQTGRLKSKPDSIGVSSRDLFERDAATRSLIAIYVFVMMLAIAAKVASGSRIEIDPWGLFVSIAPVFLIVIVGQYRLEREDTASK